MRRNAAFDGIRALAVLAVIAFHCGIPGFSGGMVGVDIFFVLSGYLITTLLVAEAAETGGIDLKAFYIRRFLRLGPPLVLMLAIYTALSPVLWPSVSQADIWISVALAATYLSDYSFAFWTVPKVFFHTWSLSVEEHFYLIWPIVMLWAVLPNSRRVQIISLVIGYLVMTEWRLGNLLATRDLQLVYFRFDTRASGLVLGALLAIVGTASFTGLRAVWLDAVGVLSLTLLAACVLYLGWSDPFALIWGTTVVEIATIGLIIAAANSETKLHKLLSTTPLEATGLISYGLYLWHAPLSKVYAPEALGWQSATLIVVPITFAAAGASYCWVERPLRSARIRWSERRRTS